METTATENRILFKHNRSTLLSDDTLHISNQRLLQNGFVFKPLSSSGRTCLPGRFTYLYSSLPVKESVTAVPRIDPLYVSRQQMSQDFLSLYFVFCFFELPNWLLRNCPSERNWPFQEMYVRSTDIADHDKNLKTRIMFLSSLFKKCV